MTGSGSPEEGQLSGGRDDRPYAAADAPTAESSFFGTGGTSVYVEHADTAPSIADRYADTDGGDEDELDSEFAPQPRKRIGKLTIGLAALLVAGAGFLGGLQVQQHEGSSASTNPVAAAAARRGTGTTGGTGGTAGTGGGTGGFSGFGGARGGAAGGTGGTTGGGTASGTGTTSIPAVIGQIVSVSGDTVVVKNLGGQEITVKLSDSTTITQTATVADLKAGQNVTVSGTTGSDGTVTATAVGTH